MKLLRTNRDMAEAIARRTDAVKNDGGTLKGKEYTHLPCQRQASDETMTAIAAVLEAHGRVYVATSYDTPIAWYDETAQEWMYVEEKQSLTASRHINLLRRTAKA